MPSLVEQAIAKVGKDRFLASLSKREKQRLKYVWKLWARPEQLEPPGDWLYWFIKTGRGWGKTRTGAETVRDKVMRGGKRRIAIVSKSAADARDVMVEGPSGIVTISPKDERPEYEPSKRRLTWPNGAVGTVYSAENPEQLRGPEHDLVWGDEIAFWPRPAAFDNLLLGLRVGVNPQLVCTSTPRPIRIVKELRDDPRTVITSGSTYENASNLAEAFLNRIIKRYEGTRLGRQELHGEILEDVEGALWTRENIDRHRVKKLPKLRRIIIPIDPAVTYGPESDLTGIIPMGLGEDRHVYVFADLSCRAHPNYWGGVVCNAYHAHKADAAVAESNQGGELITSLLGNIDPKVNVRLVHASKGKWTRAEPVAALAERGLIHHVGALPDLEDELCEWVPESFAKSPDRLDAYVWGVTDLLLADTMPDAAPIPTSTVWSPLRIKEPE